MASKKHDCVASKKRIASLEWTVFSMKERIARLIKEGVTLRDRLQFFTEAHMLLNRKNEQLREENERLRNENKQLRIDQVTGLKRRSIDTEHEIDHRIALARRHDLRIACLFFDLDNFKNVNDTLGHPEGDRALGAVGSVFNKCTREEDYVLRWGGDEFFILLTLDPNTDDPCAVANEAADRICNEIRLIPFPMQLSATVGCVIVEENESFYEALERVDREMYSVKDYE